MLDNRENAGRPCKCLVFISISNTLVAAVGLALIPLCNSTDICHFLSTTVLFFVCLFMSEGSGGSTKQHSWCFCGNNASLSALFALETGSSRAGIVWEMKAVRRPAISLCRLSCYPLLSFLIFVLSKEVQLWLPIVCTSHIISLSSVVSSWCFFIHNVIMPVLASVSTCMPVLSPFSCVVLLTVSLLFTSLLCRAINHPHSFSPQASFCSFSSSIQGLLICLCLHLLKEYSRSRLLFLVLASSFKIVFCQSWIFVCQHSRQPHSSTQLSMVCKTFCL